MTEHIYKNHILEKRRYGYTLYNLQRQVAWDVCYHKHPNYELSVIVNPVNLPQKLREIKQYIDEGIPLKEGHILIYAEDRDEAEASILLTIPVIESTETICYQWITPEPTGAITRFARLPKTLGDMSNLNKEHFGRFHYWAAYDGEGHEVWQDCCPYGYGEFFHYSYQGVMREIAIVQIEIVWECDHWFWKLSCEHEVRSCLSILG